MSDTTPTDPNAPFNFSQMAEKFSLLAQKVSSSETSENQIPLELYCSAVNDFLKVFNALGSGFAFAFKDLEDKVTTLKLWAPIHGTVKAAIEKDVSTGNLPPKDAVVGNLGKVSCIRAVNRTAHVVIFLTMFFESMFLGSSGGNSESDEKPKSLKDSISEAYENSLVQIHAFIVRNSVRVAFKLVPSRDSFLEKAGITEDQIKESGAKFVAASKIVTEAIKKEFSEKNVGWVF